MLFVVCLFFLIKVIGKVNTFKHIFKCDCLGAFEALAKMRGINVIIIIIIIRCI